MSSRENDQTTAHNQYHQPLLSSLVVRPSHSDDGGGNSERGGGGGLGGAPSTDYEPGEIRRDPPPYSRSDRYADDSGYRPRGSSVSPVRSRDAGRRYSPGFDRSGGPLRGRDFGGGRDPGRYRDRSPQYGRGRAAIRPLARDFDGPGFARRPRDEGMVRNNSNVRPREGDWMCTDPICGNLNFARREYCNKCRRFRYAPAGSPRRSYTGPAPPPPRRVPIPPIDRSPGRAMNNHRSPPRGWARGGSRDFGAGGLPPPRREGRFSDQGWRDRVDYPADDYSGRSKFDRPMPMDWGQRDRGRDSFYNERRRLERRVPSPPPPPPPLPPRDRWALDARERSRSPVRGGPPPKEYRRDMYLERGRDEKRVMGRGRIGNPY